MVNRENAPSKTNFLPKVSVVSVSYQSKEVAETTLQSILKLNYPNLEIIVVDNCSSDGTFEILSKYSSKINCQIIEKDKGPYDAMNKAIKACTGDWIWFMNMGDSVPENPNLLDEIFIEPINEITLVLYGNTRVFRGKLVYRKYFNQNIKRNFKHGILSLNHQATLIRRNAFDLNGLYQFVNCPLKADALWFTKLFYQRGGKAFQYLHKEMAFYNEEGQSSSKSNFAKMIAEDRFILSKYGSIFNKLQLEIHSIILKFRVWILIRMEKNESLYKLYRRVKFRNSKTIKNMPQE